MPNILDATGLQVATTAENATDLTTGLQAIFSDGINLDSESPDGQWVGIFAQAESDIGDLQIDIYNSFSVSSAYGTSLQRLVEINGLQIKGGTYTTTPVQVTASGAGNLPGLDQSTLPPYQLRDSAGNLWNLLSSFSFAGAGTQTLIFQCATIGIITPTPNTINAQATPYSFITAVNNAAFSLTSAGVVTNGSAVITGLTSTTGVTTGMVISDANGYFPSGTTVAAVLSSTSVQASANASGGATENVTISAGGTVLGQPYETDAALRQRQAQSFALAATCPADAVEAALLNCADIVDAVVSENRGAEVGPFPINTIWPVVVGGTPAEIAGVIYAKAAPGVGLYGANSYVITRPNGQPATMQWDTGAPQNLYAQFGIIPATPGVTFNNALLIQQLAAALVSPYFRLGRSASIGDIVRAMFAINPQVIVVSPGVSLTSGSGFTDQVSPTSAKFYFTIPAANISII